MSRRTPCCHAFLYSHMDEELISVVARRPNRRVTVEGHPPVTKEKGSERNVTIPCWRCGRGWCRRCRSRLLGGSRLGSTAPDGVNSPSLEFSKIFVEFDALISPSVGVAAPHGGAAIGVGLVEYKQLIGFVECDCWLLCAVHHSFH